MVLPSWIKWTRGKEGSPDRAGLLAEQRIVLGMGVLHSPASLGGPLSMGLSTPVTPSQIASSPKSPTPPMGGVALHSLHMFSLDPHTNCKARDSG